MCAREPLTMPELPEVETVRRGSYAGDGGARFVKVEAGGRPALALPEDFAARLEGQTVTAGPAREISARRSLLRGGPGDASRMVGLLSRAGAGA